MSLVWRDGRMIEDEAGTDPTLVGWGAFTTVGCDNGRPLLWEQHRNRLTATLGHLLPAVPVELPDERALGDLLGGAGLGGPAKLRVVASHRVSWWEVEVSVASCDDVGPSIVPARLALERWQASPPLVGHKTLARLPWDLARKQAMGAGADDVLLVDDLERVLETAVANVWVLRRGEARTPPAPARCLPGVMRGWLMNRLFGLGLRVEEGDVDLAELVAADEVWLSNAVAGVRRVAEVAGHSWKRWPLFERLAGLGIPAPGWPSPS